MPDPSRLVAFYVEGFHLMPGWMFGVFLFFVAGMVGSFLNVCIWRIPRGQSVVTPRSRCPSCAHVLGFADLIPVVSWLASGGKCRYCQTPIALRYQWVELTNIAIWMACWAALGRSPAMIGAGVAGSAVLGTLGVRMMKARMAAEARGGEPDPSAEAPAGPAAPAEAPSRRAGFTFMEILVTVAILATSVTPFMLSFQSTYRGAGKTREYIQAYNLAREKLEELRAVPPSRLRSDWEVYVGGETNIFQDEFFGPYARMKQNEANFYKGFSDVWTEDKAFTDSVMRKFQEAFKAQYGFAYERYPRGYDRFRRYTKVEDLTDPKYPNNLLKKVTVTVVIDSKITQDRPITLIAYMSNR